MFVVAENRGINQDLLVPNDQRGKARPGDVVVVAGKPDESANPDAVNGYVFRTLTKPGTAKNAFAVIAYPAEYRVSGLMTFMIGTDGITYQKDLGEKTTEVATQISEYDPDLWTRVFTAERPAKTPAAPSGR